MIQRLAILGATGDLTARYLLPGLAALRAAGELGDDFRLVAVGRKNWSENEVIKARVLLEAIMPELESVKSRMEVTGTPFD